MTKEQLEEVLGAYFEPEALRLEELATEAKTKLEARDEAKADLEEAQARLAELTTQKQERREGLLEGVLKGENVEDLRQDYLALEEEERRLKERLLELEQAAMDAGANDIAGSDAAIWQPLSGEITLQDQHGRDKAALVAKLADRVYREKVRVRAGKLMDEFSRSQSRKIQALHSPFGQERAS